MIQIGSFTIHSYGLFLAFSFLVGIYLARKRAVKFGEDPENVLSLAYYILISSIVGARLFYVVLNWSEFAGRRLDIINIFKGIGGLIFYGGFILAVVVSILYMRAKKMNIWRTSDIIAPGLALGLGFTRIGCFLNGCCFGLPAGEFPGIIFPAGSPAGASFPGIPLHPTQIYSSANGFILAAVLILAERHRSFDGYTFWLFTMIYGIFRLVIEMFRHQEEWLLMGIQGLSISQGISLLMIFSGFFMMVKGFRAKGVQRK